MDQYVVKNQKKLALGLQPEAVRRRHPKPLPQPC